MPRRIGYLKGEPDDVEGHGLRLKDAEGNDWIIASDRVRSIAWRGTDGMQHEVDGHAFKIRVLAQDPDVEGHAYKFKFRDDQGNEHHVTGLLRVTFLDDDGKEQEVEGHRWHASDLRVKRNVAPLGDALARVTAMGKRAG
jgi:hypothetical protein